MRRRESDIARQIDLLGWVKDARATRRSIAQPTFSRHHSFIISTQRELTIRKSFTDVSNGDRS
jgi:hypothetical protein